MLTCKNIFKSLLFNDEIFNIIKEYKFLKIKVVVYTDLNDIVISMNQFNM